MRRPPFAATLLVAVTLSLPAPARSGDCEPEPASQWAPAGWVCPAHYGVGWASTWEGPGAATNSCIYPWTACPPVTVQSLTTGLTIIVAPTQWCMCWVNTTGPNGETERLIDLDPQMVRALGLDPSAGLFRVDVQPWTIAIPDTAATE